MICSFVMLYICIFLFTKIKSARQGFFVQEIICCVYNASDAGNQKVGQLNEYHGC